VTWANWTQWVRSNANQQLFSQVRSTIFVFVADHHKSSSDEDDHDDDSSSEQPNLNTTTNNQCLGPAFIRTGPTISKETLAKKRRTDNDPFSVENQDKVNTDQSSSISTPVLNELNSNLIQNRKQLACLQSSVDHQQKSLDTILINQKKMAKAMRYHQVRKQRKCRVSCCFF
jgi:hypothetical protein